MDSHQRPPDRCQQRTVLSRTALWIVGRVEFGFVIVVVLAAHASAVDDRLDECITAGVDGNHPQMFVGDNVARHLARVFELGKANLHRHVLLVLKMQRLVGLKFVGQPHRFAFIGHEPAKTCQAERQPESVAESRCLRR